MPFGLLAAASPGFVAVTAGAGFCVFVGVYFALALPGRARLRQRLEPHVAAVSPSIRDRGPRAGSGAFGRLVEATERAFAERPYWQKLQLLLERAGLSLRPAQFVYISLGASFVLGLLAAVVALPSALIILALIVGAFVPYLYVSVKANRRMRALEAQLPDVLTTLAGLLKAGHSLRQGMQTVAEDSSPPISTEFSRALSEMELGLSLDDSLVQMGKRVGSEEFDFVISAITIQREVGGSLANFFDLISNIVRERQQFSQKVRAITATGRASATVLLTMPFIIAVLLTATNHEYMSPLYNTNTGHVLILLALGMMTLGGLIVRRMIRSEG